MVRYHKATARVAKLKKNMTTPNADKDMSKITHEVNSHHRNLHKLFHLNCRVCTGLCDQSQNVI